MAHALSGEDGDRMRYFKLQGLLENTIQNSWASKTSSIVRVYLFFGYDDDLNLGNGLSCVGYRFRLMKVPISGDWKAIDISSWAENPSRDYFASLYHPFDGLPGILEDDRDYFAI